MDYMVQRERQSWDVWSCKPHTGDRAYFVRSFRTKRDVLRAIDVLHRNAALKAVLTKNIDRLLASGQKPITEQA